MAETIPLTAMTIKPLEAKSDPAIPECQVVEAIENQVGRAESGRSRITESTGLSTRIPSRQKNLRDEKKYKKYINSIKGIKKLTKSIEDRPWETEFRSTGKES
jgi:hypothetical protein